MKTNKPAPDEFEQLFQEFQAQYFDLVAREMPLEDLPTGRLTGRQLCKIQRAIEQAKLEQIATPRKKGLLAGVVDKLKAGVEAFGEAGRVIQVSLIVSSCVLVAASASLWWSIGTQRKVLSLYTSDMANLAAVDNALVEELDKQGSLSERGQHVATLKLIGCDAWDPQFKSFADRWTPKITETEHKWRWHFALFEKHLARDEHDLAYVDANISVMTMLEQPKSDWNDAFALRVAKLARQRDDLQLVLKISERFVSFDRSEWEHGFKLRGEILIDRLASLIKLDKWEEAIELANGLYSDDVLFQLDSVTRFGLDVRAAYIYVDGGGRRTAESCIASARAILEDLVPLNTLQNRLFLMQSESFVNYERKDYQRVIELTEPLNEMLTQLPEGFEASFKSGINSMCCRVKAKIILGETKEAALESIDFLKQIRQSKSALATARESQTEMVTVMALAANGNYEAAVNLATSSLGKSLSEYERDRVMLDRAFCLNALGKYSEAYQDYADVAKRNSTLSDYARVNAAIAMTKIPSSVEEGETTLAELAARFSSDATLSHAIESREMSFPKDVPLLSLETFN